MDPQEEVEPETAVLESTTTQNAVDADASAEDELQKRLEGLFNTDAVNGVINGPTLCSILVELGMAVEEDQVHDLVGDAWNEIDMHLASDVLQHVRPTEAGKRGLAEAEEQLAVAEVVFIYPWEMLWRKLTCAATPPNTEYRMKMPSFDLQPRHLLIANTAIFMLLTNAGIIVAIALLWLSYANSAANDNYARIGIALENFMENYDSELMERQGAELRDATTIIATVVDTEATANMEQERQRMGQMNEMAMNYLAVQAAASSGQDQVAESLRTVASLVEGRTKAGNPLSSSSVLRAVLAATASYGTLGWYTVIVHNASSTVLGEVRPLCSSATCNLKIECISSKQLTDGRLYLWNATADVQGQSALAVSLALSNGMRVCSMLSQPTFQQRTRDLMIRRSTTPLGILRRRFDAEAILAEVVSSSTATNPLVQWLTPHLYAPQSCYFALDDTKCHEQNRLVWSVAVTRETSSQYLTDKSGVLSVAVASSALNIVLLLTVHRSQLLDETISELSDVFDYMNDIRINQKGFTIEFAIFTQNATTLDLTETNTFMKSDECIMGQCVRLPAVLAPLKAAFELGGSAYLISHDYRPLPVVLAYTFSPLRLTNVVVAVERGVKALRALTLSSLVEQINANNPNFAATFEIQMVHYKGRELTRTFDPAEPCPSRSITCASRDGYGIVYRSDCRDCTPQFASVTNSTLLEYLTKPKLVKCDLLETSECTQKMAVGSGVARESLEKYDSSGVVRMKDSRGVSVIGYHGYIANISFGYAIKEDYSDVSAPVINKITLSIGVSCGIFAVGLLFLIALAYRLILTIEEEWMSFKRQMVEMRENFADAVREMMPGDVAEKLLQSTKAIAGSENVCIAFVHMGGTSTRTKKWAPMALCRFLTYTFHLTEQIAVNYRIHRMRTIGDTGVFISTAQDIGEFAADEGAEDERWSWHFVLRMLQFCTNVVQLTTIRYAHFPHRTRLTRGVFGGSAFEYPDTSGNPESLGYLRMPQFQIGVNTGVATIAAFQTATAPQFDALGATASIASKIAGVSKPDLVLVSESTRNQAMKRDKGLFEYGEAKPIMLRGHGTINTYFLTMGDVHVPPQVVRDAAIRFAKLRVTFSSDDGLQRVIRDQSVLSVSTSSSGAGEGTRSDAHSSDQGGANPQYAERPRL